MTASITGFAGFRPAAFAFLNELRDNNDPAWFKPRKALYEAEVLGPFGDLITAVGATLRKTGEPLVGDPRRGIFFDCRDIFSLRLERNVPYRMDEPSYCARSNLWVRIGFHADFSLRSGERLADSKSWAEQACPSNV